MEPTKVVEKPAETILKPIDLVALIKQAHPKLLGKLDDKAAAFLVRATLEQISEAIAANSEGIMRFPGLGNFTTRQVLRNKDGEQISVKQVIYRSPKL